MKKETKDKLTLAFAVIAIIGILTGVGLSPLWVWLCNGHRTTIAVYILIFAVLFLPALLIGVAIGQVVEKLYELAEDAYSRIKARRRAKKEKKEIG